ncbi:RluA family pseudouridine synthase [candidate division WOR-3 bacterium]|nr:RluA family pseudouridine synthase [candidate division WOR-3 bacterium]
MIEFYRIVKPKEKIRLDKYLYKAGLGISRSQIQRLVEAQKVLVNDKPAKPHTPLVPGDKVIVNYKKPERFKVESENIPLDIVYEDQHIIVVNKPPGMVTHPAPGNLHGTLVNALLYHCELSWQTDRTRPGVLHRLDKDTSGLLVFAKSDPALLKLAHQVETHKLKRKYLAFAWGKFELNEGTIDAPIGRHAIERKQMAVTPLASRRSITYFKVIQKFRYITYLKLKLETGRTHQIRVHLAHLNHPVVGDLTYNGRKRPLGVPENEFYEIMSIMPRQALHAAQLGFEHPIHKKSVELDTPLPQDMQKLLDWLNHR